MTVCDSRAENNAPEESVCQVRVLGAPLCIRVKTEHNVCQEKPRNFHYSTGR
jgi:hypothetical protein